MARLLLPILVLTAACTAPATPAEGPGAAYLPDQLMVRADAGAPLEAVFQHSEARILRRAGPGQLALVEASPGHGPGLLSALRANPRVAEAWPVGRLDGAGSHGVEAGPDAWHLEAARVPAHADLHGLTVAVLDSGVAYAERREGDSYWAPVASLAGVDFVAPQDFVDDDPWPHDEHQHGTLITSLIASQGHVRGAAPGASVMPLRVLDENNTGDELSLIDALHWAVDHDADVVNMSLGFPPGYVPSRPLVDALQRAADAGVVLVASAGNHGQAMVTWPAASPLVIAAGAGSPAAHGPRGWRGRHLAPTDYTGRHAAVDLLAPGGDLSVDHTGDGYPDGLVAESIFPGDPTRTGTWLSAGSSQATAMTSAASLHLLAGGVPPDEIARSLQTAARASSAGGTPYTEGLGAGTLDIAAGLPARGRPLEGSYHAALLPYLSAAGDEPRPAARITVIDEDGERVHGGTVIGTFTGTGTTTATCTLVDGACTLLGPDDDALAWRVTVDAVVHGRAAWRPGGALFAADTLEVLLAALIEHPDLQDAVLALYWGDETHDELGEIAESWAIVDTGTGLATSPVGVILSTTFVEAYGTTEPIAVDLEGTGLATSPVGFHRLRLRGAGLATSPILGLRTLDLAVIDGNGLATSPVGFGGDRLYADLGARWNSPSISLDGAPLLLSSGTLVGIDPAGTLTGAWIEQGGWTAAGYPAASLLGAATFRPPVAGDANAAAGVIFLQE